VLDLLTVLYFDSCKNYFIFKGDINSFKAFTENPLSLQKTIKPPSSIKATLVFLGFSFPVNS
jgi:hypothetical protein